MKRTKPYKSEGIRPLFLLPLCDPLWVFELLVWTWVLPLCSSFPPLLGAMFDGACQGFIIRPQMQTRERQMCGVEAGGFSFVVCMAIGLLSDMALKSASKQSHKHQHPLKTLLFPLTLELEKFSWRSNHHLQLHFGLIDIDLPYIWNWLATYMNKQVVIASNWSSWCTEKSCLFWFASVCVCQSYVHWMNV